MAKTEGKLCVLIGVKGENIDRHLRKNPNRVSPGIWQFLLTFSILHVLFKMSEKGSTLLHPDDSN